MSESMNCRPVWAEGILLTQQHMQAMENHFESQEIARYQMSQVDAYGFGRLVLDTTMLDQGWLAVKQLFCIFENGRLLEFNAVPGQELRLSLSDDDDCVDVILALPANRAVDDIEGYQRCGQPTAYRAEYIELSDAHDPARTREVMIATPTPRLLSGTPALGEFDCLPLCRVRCLAHGSFSLEPAFVPPLININASDFLRDWLGRQLQRLNAKVNELIGWTHRESHNRSSSSADFTQQWLLCALRSAIALLAHFQTLKRLHPERVYGEVVRLIAALSVSESGRPLAPVVHYQHKQLGTVFTMLEQMIDCQLAALTSSQSKGLTLERLNEAQYQAVDIDREQFEHGDFYLAVYIESADIQWIESFANQVKVGPREHMEMIVASALQGATLSHCQRPPDNLKVKSGFEYFRIDPFGEFWLAIVEEQAMGLFVPLALQQAKIELITVDRG